MTHPGPGDDHAGVPRLLHSGDDPAVLDQILNEASRKGDVLLLDEADALFAKRSTVQDSHDRYSPTRQDELLNRLSAHRGPIVVAPESSAGGASQPDDLEPPT